MANLTYGVIKGEADFNAYCLKRWKTEARFCESFAHNIAGVFIERIYAKSPTDEYYEQYFIMSMEARKDTPWNCVDTIRKKVYEDPQGVRNEDAEILAEGEDGILYDIEIEDTEEVFDGFDTFYPAGLKIITKK